MQLQVDPNLNKFVEGLRQQHKDESFETSSRDNLIVIRDDDDDLILPDSSLDDIESEAMTHHTSRNSSFSSSSTASSPAISRAESQVYQAITMDIPFAESRPAPGGCPVQSSICTS